MADPLDWPTNSNPIDVSDELGGEQDGDTYYFTGNAEDEDNRTRSPSIPLMPTTLANMWLAT